jgi:hypothetical protein
MIGDHHIIINKPVQGRGNEHDGRKGKAHPDGRFHLFRYAEEDAEAQVAGKHEIVDERRCDEYCQDMLQHDIPSG